MNNFKFLLSILLIGMLLTRCNIPSLVQHNKQTALPDKYTLELESDSSNIPKWKAYYTDPFLVELIDSALQNNQELHIISQEIQIHSNEIMARKGEFLPSLGLGLYADAAKPGRYTRDGAVEANVDIAPSVEMPEPLTNLSAAGYASWELDVWKKLRNAKKAAVHRYLASQFGKEFMVTRLVSEISTAYYELLALDNMTKAIASTIDIQQKALRTLQQQKKAAMVTELPVKRFEAELLKNQSILFEINQQVIELENEINFLVGRFPQPVKRNATSFSPDAISDFQVGIPAELLENRPDVKAAELNLQAAKLDVKSAKANFYPSVRITGNIGLEAFNPAHLIKTPESILYGITGDLIAPLINRKAIKATYLNANAKQIQALYEYEQTILNAFIEVVNQLSYVKNLNQSYALRQQQVNALQMSTTVSLKLFNSARADYMEVLMTQRDGIEANMELIETQNKLLQSKVRLYQALGGGW